MLVPFFVIMVSKSRMKRPIREEEDEEVGYSGFDENLEEEYAEEEGESGEHKATETPTKQDQSQTPLWKYVQRQEGGKEGKVMEPLNFFAPIAIKNTQVHTSMPEGTFVGKCQGMERKI